MAEPLNATFFAFRKREQGGVLMAASFGFVIGLIGIFALMAALLWNIMAPVFAWYGELFAAGAGAAGGVPPSPPPMGILWLFPAQFLFLFLLFVLFAAYEAACHRWMIRGESGGGLLGLNLGPDTWRVYATYWVWFGVFLVLYFFCLFVIISAGVSVAQGGVDIGASGLIMFALMLAVLCAVVYLAVRLAPAAATSVGRQRFSFFSAWTVTRDRFWALLGAFLLLIVLNIVASMVLSTVMFGVLFASAFSTLDWGVAANDPNAFALAYFAAVTSLFTNPASLAILIGYYVVATAIGMLFYVLFFGVNSRAVQAALEEGKIAPEPAS